MLVYYTYAEKNGFKFILQIYQIDQGIEATVRPWGGDMGEAVSDTMLGALSVFSEYTVAKVVVDKTRDFQNTVWYN